MIDTPLLTLICDDKSNYIRSSSARRSYSGAEKCVCVSLWGDGYERRPRIMLSLQFSHMLRASLYAAYVLVIKCTNTYIDTWIFADTVNEDATAAWQVKENCTVELNKLIWEKPESGVGQRGIYRAKTLLWEYAFIWHTRYYIHLHTLKHMQMHAKQ